MKQNRLLKHVFTLIALPLVAHQISTQALFGQHSLSPGMNDSRGEEIVEAPSGFSALLNLDHGSLQTLVEQGSISTYIPSHLVGHVEAIVLRQPQVFKDDAADSFANAQLVGQQLIVDVDQAILGRIGYQPVKLRVYESPFSSIVLRLVANDEIAVEEAVSDDQRDSPWTTLKLKTGNGIVGRIRDTRNLKLNSTFGKILVKLSRVSKIEFRKDNTLSVETSSGDLISGKLGKRSLAFVSRWGTEKILLKDISELNFHDDRQ